MHHIFIKTHFSAGHHLRNYPGNCEKPHGHNWKVEVTVKANDLDELGMGIDFRDLKRVRYEAEFGAQLGFSGKQIIHPNQVGPVQDAFTPDDESIAHAQRVVEVFESHQKEGKGAFALDGQMIDMPLVKNAQKVLERAKAAGKI